VVIILQGSRDAPPVREAKKEKGMPTPKVANAQRASGFGSVHEVPKLVQGFTDVFDSWWIEANGVRLHAVIGGTGPPLVMIAGWPQNWFAWRHLMLPLARQFTVVAADPRGVGLSEATQDGYDCSTLAADMLALMAVLGHERFAVAGHDIGAWIAYAMAVDRPDCIDRVALGEAIIPGVTPAPPLLAEDRRLSEFLWHFSFNRALYVNERLVEGREEIYFGHHFATKAGWPGALPAYARDFYIAQLKRSSDALRASFEFFRALDKSIAQNRERSKTELRLPILAYSGALALGDTIAQDLRSIGTTVQSFVVEASGHNPAEEKPGALLQAFDEFFRPYAASRRADPVY
jgi:pimeloyl-ACP methyl ester carboxylesterase